MKIDYKGGTIIHNVYDAIDWNKKITFDNEGFLSQDILQIEYGKCLIDMGWYGGPNGCFMIMVIIHRYEDEDGSNFSAEDWAYPFAKIPCENQWDMAIQLQRAIDVYPQLTKNFQ
jgi:hypothetical protein